MALRRTRALVAPALLTALVPAVLGGCTAAAGPGPVPSATAHVGSPAAPDVTGVVGTAALPSGGTGPVLTAASDDYFEGMSLGGDDVAVLGVEPGADGEPTVADLADGDAVEVWLREPVACAESSPVQCAVLTVRVTG